MEQISRLICAWLWTFLNIFEQFLAFLNDLSESITHDQTWIFSRYASTLMIDLLIDLELLIAPKTWFTASFYSILFWICLSIKLVENEQVKDKRTKSFQEI